MNEPRNQGRSVTKGLPWRYRFADADGKRYARFRLRPGVSIRDVVAQAFPGDASDTDWSLEKA